MPVRSPRPATVTAKAREAIAELDRGAKFQDIVEKYSMHPSRNRGGI